MKPRLCIFVLISVIALGIAPLFSQNEYFNILAFDGNGRPRLPAKPGSKLDADQFSRRINELEKEVTQHIQDHDAPEITIYIHGGLVSLRKGIDENKAITNYVKEHDPEVYPVCINWETGLIPSYFQQLAVIRQGERHPFFGALSSPFYLYYDLVRGFVRIPQSMYMQMVNDINSIYHLNRINSRRQNADSTYLSLKRDPEFSDNIYYGDDHRSGIQRHLQATSYWSTVLFRYTLGLGFVDFLGTNSWSNMKRRSSLMFRNQKEFDVRKIRQSRIELRELHKSTGTGPIFEMLTMLDSLLKSQADLGKPIKVNLIGHSMGAIIACRMLHEYPELKFNNVVFMGAACSISEFEYSVIPYMRLYDTRFHNLMLHPAAESKEAVMIAGPGGSLLEWIDNFFEPISAFQGRTFGKFENAIMAAHLVPEDLRSRVTFKTFDLKTDGSVPIKHGEFNDIPDPEDKHSKSYIFWSEEFWVIPTSVK